MTRLRSGHGPRRPPTADGRSITGHTVSPSGTGRSPITHLSHSEHDLVGWGEAPLGLQRHQLARDIIGEAGRRLERRARADEELADARRHVLLDHVTGGWPAGSNEVRRVCVRPPLANGLGKPGRDVSAGHRQADAEVLGIDLAACRRGGHLDDLAPRASLVRGDKAGQPAVAEPADPPQPARCAAAQPDVQRFSGSGPMLAASTLKYLPWKDTVCCRRSSRRSSRDSSNTAPRCPGGTGKRARSALRAGCSPKTGRTRAGARPASDASCLATRTGWRPGSTDTPVPTFSLAVRVRAYAIPVNGSTSGPYTISDSHSESMPSSSRRLTAAASSPGAAAAPSPIPIRIFTCLSDHEGCRPPRPAWAPPAGQAKPLLCGFLARVECGQAVTHPPQQLRILHHDYGGERCPAAATASRQRIRHGHQVIARCRAGNMQLAPHDFPAAAQAEVIPL